MKLNENQKFAKLLRKNMTPWERKLWYCFLSNYKIKFRRQQLLENYIVDFYCPKVKLILELDGGGHYEMETKNKDILRDENLKSKGYVIVRILNTDIDKNFGNVCDYINYMVEKLLPPSV